MRIMQNVYSAKIFTFTVDKYIDIIDIDIDIDINIYIYIHISISINMYICMYIYIYIYIYNIYNICIHTYINT